MKNLQKLYLSALFVLVLNFPAYSQIVPDNTVGTKLTPNVLVDGDLIDGGAIQGGNLFHSFQEFNINAGRSVYFTNPTDVTNIFTRVTGANISNINGILGVVGDANLFLMNPNGIVFGSGASLDVKGSFFGITASSINFADGTVFSAMTNSSSNPLLSVSVPIGLGFGSNPATIQLQSANLLTAGAKGEILGLIGGNVILKEGATVATGGRIEIGSVANGEVQIIPSTIGGQLNYDKVKEFGNIQLVSGSSLLNDSSASDTAGGIQIQGQRISLDNSQIVTQTQGTQKSGDITINAREALQLTGAASGSQIVSLVNPSASGASGSINVMAPSLIMDDGSTIQSVTQGTGSSGDIVISTRQIDFKNSGQVRTLVDLEATGNSGSIQVNATESITADGRKFDTGSGITSVNLGLGDAGNLSVSAKNINFTNAAGLVSTNLGIGRAGDIVVKVEDTINAQGGYAMNPIIASGIKSYTFSSGNGGNLKVSAENLYLSSGAEVATYVSSQLDGLMLPEAGTGNAGDIFVKANNIDVVGASPWMPSRTTVLGSTSNGSGSAGNVNVSTRRLSVRDGAALSSALIPSFLFVGQSSASSVKGQSGNITVNASEAIEITGGSSFDDSSTISTFTFGVGDAGQTFINTPRLIIQNGGTLGSLTLASGNAGKINVNTQELIVDGVGSSIYSGALVASEEFQRLYFLPSIPTGNTGELNINARRIDVTNGGQISVEHQGIGKAGELSILSNSIQLSNSEIKATAGSNGDGGNIKLDIGAIVLLENSKITADAVQGKGGNITINTQGLFKTTDTSITATGTISNGKVEIVTPDIKQDSSLQQQPNNFVVTDAIVTNTCLVSRNASHGTFMATGNGGLPETPNTNLSSNYELTQVQPVNSSNLTISTQRNADTARTWKIGAPIVEAQSLQFTNGKVLLASADSYKKVSQATEVVCQD